MVTVKDTPKNEKKSFLKALTGDRIALKPTNLPSVESGNICVQIDEDELQEV